MGAVNASLRSRRHPKRQKSTHLYQSSLHSVRRGQAPPGQLPTTETNRKYENRNVNLHFFSNGSFLSRSQRSPRVDILLDISTYSHAGGRERGERATYSLVAVAYQVSILSIDHANPVRDGSPFLLLLIETHLRHLYHYVPCRGEELYSDWREHMRKARDEAAPVFTPRGNSLKVTLGGVTDRAGPQQTPRVSKHRSDIGRFRYRLDPISTDPISTQVRFRQVRY